MKQLGLVILFLFSLTTKAQYMEAAGLTFLLHKPHAPSAKAPLLILLHGYGSNEQDLMGLADQLPQQYTIVSARAPITLSTGSYAWYHLDMSSGKTVYSAVEAEQSRQQLFRFIDELKQKYHASEVVLLGFSQGAIMSYSVALTQPQKVKGIVALSGRLLTDIEPHLASREKLQQLHVFIGHGKTDPVLPFTHGEAAYAKCKKLGTQVTFKEYPMRHEISSQELLDIQRWFQQFMHSK